MIGETTLDQRILRQLKWIEEVRKKYADRYNNLNDEDLVAELIADATYLATYQGIDLDSLIEETVKDVRFHFPDIT